MADFSSLLWLPPHLRESIIAHVDMKEPEQGGDALTFLDHPLVVEIGHRIGVGACGQLLAQLGASVVVVEPTEPRLDNKWRNRSAMTAGKRSFALAESNAADDSEMHELLARADIVLLSSDDGVGKFELWDAPRPSTQIVCDITAFGHTGPLAGSGASEAIVAALAGVVETTGAADGPPSLIGAPVLEMSSAVFAASAVLAALRVRRRHGYGQRIDIAIFDTAVNQLANFLPLEFEGQTATRSGNRHPLHRPWGSYRTRDGHVLVCAATQDHFTRLCAAIGRPEMVEDARFRDSAGRLKHFEVLDEALEVWTSQRSTKECQTILLDLGVASGAIISPGELLAEANVAHRQSARLLHDDAGEPHMVPGNLLRSVPRAGVAPNEIPGRDNAREFVQDLLRRTPGAPQGQRVSGDRPAGVRPLEGVTVVEIGQYTVAPLASRHLGALGATVIKVESPTGDATRSSAPLRQDGLAHIFALSNTDKRGLVLDLRKPEQRDMLHRLLARADILLENMRPGALVKLGFSSDVLRSRHPHLVYCAISGFGHDSAYPGRPALDTVIQAMSGLMSTTKVNGTPTKAGISASDMLGGQFGLMATLAGLELRERTKITVHFDISMQDTSIWMTQLAWPGSCPPPITSVVDASDGYIVVDEGNSPAAGGPTTTGAGPLTRSELVVLYGEAGILCAPVASIAEVVTSPQVKARELLIDRPTADGDKWKVLGTPMRLLSTPSAVKVVMSRLGAEDASVIRDFALTTLPEGGSPSSQPIPSEAQ